jgi:hypothetical protein
MKQAIKIELDTIWEGDRVVTFNVSMPVEKIGFIRNFLNYHGHVVTTGRDVEGHPSFNTTMKVQDVLGLFFKDKTEDEEEVVNGILNTMSAMLYYHKPVERRFHLPFFPDELVKIWFGVFSWRVQKNRVKSALYLSGYYCKHGGYDNRAAPEDIFAEVDMDIANENDEYLGHCCFYKQQFFNTGHEFLTGLVEL